MHITFERKKITTCKKCDYFVVTLGVGAVFRDHCRKTSLEMVITTSPNKQHMCVKQHMCGQ